MGREIEKAAISQSHEIVAIVNQADEWAAKEERIRLADAVIEFSMPGSAVDNIRRCFDLHLPVVVGTTGWNDQRDLVRQWCEAEGQSIFVGANFSIGVNILFALTQQLTKYLNHLPDMDITLEEIHHIHKLDAPSGTALRLAEIILSGSDRKTHWVNRTGQNPNELEIISIREGEIAGQHTIKCSSATDRLTLTHEAIGRQGFASGALKAAEWLQGKKGWFGMNDLLQLSSVAP